MIERLFFLVLIWVFTIWPFTDFDGVHDMKAIHSVIRSMKAVRISEFGGPRVLKVHHQVAVPEPEENQILMKVAYSGVNPVDTYIRQGAYSRLPELPYTPGNDGAGTVVKVGANVTEFKEGDRVFCAKSETGTAAEYCVVNKNFAWHLGSRLDFRQGAGVGVPYFTAYRALFMRANAKAGEKVLVHGASGAVGLAACQLASAAGLTVLGTAGSPAGLDLAMKVGAKHVFNHREKGYPDKILEAADGEGVDVIIEMLANVNLPTDLTLLRRHGRIIILGSRGSTKIDPRATMGKETSIMGIALLSSSLDDWKFMGEQVRTSIEAGSVNPIIDVEYPLENMADAHEEVMKHSGGGAKGKIVVKVDA